ncbi:MAG TPA: sigma-54-dependent Fis family transcriptional regulator [bacterium]|nr:sigma-54-dependent Fis family transcriptional regulator [bacterium]
MEKAKLLIIEDNEDLVFTLNNVLKKEGHKVISVSSAEAGIDIFQKEIIDLVLLDLKLPKMDGIQALNKIKEFDPDALVIMMTALTDPKPAIEAMKKGAYDYLMKPFELDEMKLVVRKALETHQLKREVFRLKRAHQEKNPVDVLYGESAEIIHVRDLVKVVAETPKTSVLIEGESGTGKELVANAIHYSSQRADQPFIKINCSAIPDHLLESELFGHEKGAFTDAKAIKKGLFEFANGGTIFLDEISSMKLALQPKILRVIESQTVRRIGGLIDIKIDVRVVAATNTELAKLVKNKEFRDDLYYRLKVLEIKIPPLRERKEDILLLTKLFLQEFNKEFNRHIQKLDKKTEELLTAYSWPGNVRELKNVIERAVILCRDDILMPENLPLEIKTGSDIPHSRVGSPGKISLQEMEKIHIAEILKTVGGNKSQAARILDISRSTLREKLKSYRIE